MVLRNYENRRDRRKTEEKAHKIERKRLVLAEKRYIDLNLSDEMSFEKPEFMRGASIFV